MKVEVFDKIYIGSSPIMMLDALNSNLKNKKVLIIDKSNVLGGAWKSIELFGCKNLENAVHYLLPNEEGYNFLENIFNVELEDSKRKFYALKILDIKFLISVKNFLGKIIYLINGGDQRDNLTKKLFFKKLFSKSHVKSTLYPKGGISQVVEKIKEKVICSSIELKLNEEILFINIKDDLAFIETNKRNFIGKKMFISHGFIPPDKFYINNKKVLLNLKKHPRPSLHINTICDEKVKKYSLPFRFSQVLFPKGSNIKYVHQISQFLDSRKDKKQQIVVVALRHDLKNNFLNYLKIAKELEDFGVIPKVKQRLKKDFYWQDILIPQIDDNDLNYICNRSRNVIESFKTECFNTALGNYSKIWNFKKEFFK